MEKQNIEFRIGLMVCAAILALVFLTIYFGKGQTMRFGEDYTIRVRFQRTPGIGKKSPVYKNGVAIGSVSKVELVDNDREVEISILLPKERKVYTDEECRIRQKVIMGDASLEFVKKTNYTGKIRPIGPDDPPLIGGSSTDLLSGFSNMEGELTKAIDNVSTAAVQFTTVAEQVGDFMERINSVVGTQEELNVRKMTFDAAVNEMRITLKSMNDMASGASRIINDPQIETNIRQVINGLPEMIEQTKSLLSDTQGFIHDGRELAARGKPTLDKIDLTLDKANHGIDTVIGLTDQVGTDIAELMASLRKSSGKLETFLDELVSIVQAVQNADGTVKKLMRDPELYHKLLATIDNIEQVSSEVKMMLRTDVKPITNNVKIITDKVARDPSIFIRNLMRNQKQPPIKSALPIWGDGLGSDQLGDLTCDVTQFTRDSLYNHEIEYQDLQTVPESPDWQPTLAPTPEKSEDILFIPPNAKKSSFGFGKRVSALLPSFSNPFYSNKKVQGTFSIPGEQIAYVQQNITEESNLEESSHEDKIVLTPPLTHINETNQPDTVPEEGRIVQVDPRFHAEKGSSQYKQMSYETETESEQHDGFPKLIFAK